MTHDARFEVERLGPATIPSPLHLSKEMGDKAANYVPDDERVLLHTSLRSWEECRDRGEEPPSMEVAGPREFIYRNPATTCAAIVTCGGLCPGLNDVIRGLVMSLYYDYGVQRVYGIRYGYYGMIDHHGEAPVAFTPQDVEGIDALGGSILRSSRGGQDVVESVDFLARRKINVLFTVGGDGTQKGGLDISEEAKKRSLPISVIGIPKTIDNDISFVERTFGFETAFSVAKDVLVGAHVEAIGALNGICIVKLMGRHSGFLATMATIASGNVNFLLVPEVPFELEGGERISGRSGKADSGAQACAGCRRRGGRAGSVGGRGQEIGSRRFRQYPPGGYRPLFV
ncbi:MAG: 6-phosphofructokinase [bacterium]